MVWLILCLCCGFAVAEDTITQTADAGQPAEMTVNVADIQRYGHLMLDISGSSILEMDRG